LFSMFILNKSLLLIKTWHVDDLSKENVVIIWFIIIVYTLNINDTQWDKKHKNIASISLSSIKQLNCLLPVDITFESIINR
jgi:uncharacterized membrane protein YkvI